MHRVVNRPHALLSFEKLLDGLIKLRQEFQGQYWLEVFLLDGLTAVEPEVMKIVECVKLIEPDRVQLNTVCRPPAEGGAVGVARERMLEFASLFHPAGEVISHFAGIHDEPGLSAGLADVLNTLRRRPCSLNDIADGLGIHRAEATKYVERLSAEGLVERTWVEGRPYFRLMRG
jgi:wyosine [tRNA(Phe)-imidazoG37] synthetase (radical SAM superfamily)